MNDLIYEIPYLPTDRSVERLRIFNSEPTPTEVDIAISQDIFHKHTDLSQLEQFARGANRPTDYSLDGNSVSMWIYRLGGSDALLKSFPFAKEQERALIVRIGSHVIPENQWLKDIAAKDENPITLLSITQTAIEKNDEEIITIIKQKLSSLEKNLRTREDVENLDNLEQEIALHDFRKRLKSGEIINIDEEELSIIPLGEQMTDLQERLYTDDVTEEEFIREERKIRLAHRNSIEHRVAQAVARKDVAALDEYIDPTGISIAEIGRSVLNGNPETIQKKPIYEMEDLTEIKTDLYHQIMTASNDVDVTSDGHVFRRDRVPAVEDRTFWLVTRLGQLGDIATLKEVVNMHDCRVEAREEAVRQLLVLGQTSFLQEYAAQNNAEQVKFWETIKNVKKGFDDKSQESLEEHATMVHRLENDVPFFVSAIIG